MAQRFTKREVRWLIALSTSLKYMSKEVAYRFENEMDKDDNNRIKYMREAIRRKFDNNPKLKEKLLNTGNREIIEFTYWWDDFFWIDNKTRKGRNFLLKIQILLLTITL